MEETGLAIRLTRFLQLTQMLGQDGEHWVAPVWLAEVVEGEARNLEPDKAEAVAWFALSDPPAPLGRRRARRLRGSLTRRSLVNEATPDERRPPRAPSRRVPDAR